MINYRAVFICLYKLSRVYGKTQWIITLRKSKLMNTDDIAYIPGLYGYLVKKEQYEPPLRNEY